MLQWTLLLQRFQKRPWTLSKQKKKKKKVETAAEGENKMAVDCFLKELTRPDPLELRHLLNGRYFICFVPITTESPERHGGPFTLVFSQTTRLTFPLLVSVEWKKKHQGFLTQSQEAMPRYVCAVITRSDGRQIGEGQRRSCTHTLRTRDTLAQRVHRAETGNII